MSHEGDNSIPIVINEENAKILGKITGATGLEDCDNIIAANAYSQFTIAGVLILVYLVCRNKTPWVYYPNIKNKPMHPCYQAHPGLFRWVKPLVTIKDTKLLGTIGLDGFMLLQLIKMLYRMFLLICIIVLPIFWTVIKDGAKKDKPESQLFVQMTIAGKATPDACWRIGGLCYAITAMVLYLIFIYYKRFVTLRQLYLATPATMTSIGEMKRISHKLGSDQNAVNYVNVSSKTVLIDRLPASIKNDVELLAYVTSLGIGEIESVALVQDTYILQKMYEQRDAIIQDIEKEVATAYIRLKAFYRKAPFKDTLGDKYREEMEDAVEALFADSYFDGPQKAAYFNQFCRHGARFLNKTRGGKLVIDLHLTRLCEINKKICEEKQRLIDDGKDNKEPEANAPTADETLFVETDVRHDVSFFSLSQIIHFIRNKDLFSLDLPANRKKGFVTFTDQRTAAIIRQTRLGTRIFSSNIHPAPAPYDVLWRNIGSSEITGFFFRTLSLALYVLLNIFFLIIAVKIIESLKIPKETSNYIFRFILKTPYLYSIYKGILAPLIYNILLFFVPIIIKVLLHLEDNLSYSQLQAKLMFRLSFFLFINAFLATIVASCSLGFLQSIKAGNSSFSVLVSEFGSSLISSSVFFFNTVIQRVCVGSVIVILKPSPFLYNWILAPMVIYTRRQEREREFSPPFDFGIHLPNLLLIAPMTLVYSCICPALVIVSFFFYLFSYIVYKNEFLYASRNAFESGGSYWRQCIKFLFISLLCFQLLTAAFIYSTSYYPAFYIFIPLIFLTYVFSEGILTLFQSSCENFPMNGPEEKFLDAFSRKTLEERRNALVEWTEIGEGFDEDAISISDIGLEDNTTDQNPSFYRDPSMNVTIGSIILPLNFFKTICFLQAYDKENLTGLNP